MESALTAAQNVANVAFQQSENTKNREFASTEAEKAWYRDQLAWAMQNQYNTPAAQMARYLAAGLNPNLIYQQGNSGNASDRFKYTPAQYQGIAPKIEGFAGLGVRQADIMQRAAMTKNLEAQNEQIQVQKVKTLQEIKNLITDNENAIRSGHLTDEQIAHLKTENAYYERMIVSQLESQASQRDLNDAMMIKSYIDMIESGARIDYINEQKGLVSAQAAGQRYDNAVKKFHASLADRGIDPNDPWYARYMERAINQFLSGKTLEDVVDYLKHDIFGLENEDPPYWESSRRNSAPNYHVPGRFQRIWNRFTSGPLRWNSYNHRLYRDRGTGKRF